MSDEATTVQIYRELKKVGANVTLTHKAVLGLRDRVAALERHLYGDGARTARRCKKRK